MTLTIKMKPMISSIKERSESFDTGTILAGVTGVIVGIWIGLGQVTQALILLMIVDMVSGILAAFITKTVDSEVGSRGVAKKAMIIMIVALAHWLQSAAIIGIPIGEVVAGFYCAIQAISVMENAARAGVPVPKSLKDALVALNKTGEGVPDKT
jgi:toxin secretion/phage lysis holin